MCRIKGSFPCHPIRSVYQFAWIYWDSQTDQLSAIPTVSSNQCSGSSRLLTVQKSNGIIHAPVQSESISDGAILPVTMIGPLDHLIDGCVPAPQSDCHQKSVCHHAMSSFQQSVKVDHAKKSGPDRITRNAELKVGLLVCSDRAYKGEYSDKSGPAAAAFLYERGFVDVETVIVPDDSELIRQQIRIWTVGRDRMSVARSGPADFYLGLA